MKKIVIAGSFAVFEEMKELAKKLETELKTKCILPRHFRGYDNSIKIEDLKRRFKNGKIELTKEDLLKIGRVENWFLKQIEKADLVLVYNKKQKEGEIGINTTMDIGYALGKGKRVIFLYPPLDVGIKGFFTYCNKKAKVVSPNKIVNYLKSLA
jgi:nucleoside 2-deoxyribosyltransferase